LSATSSAYGRFFFFGLWRIHKIYRTRIYPTTHRAIDSRDVIDFFITSGMMRSLFLSRRLQSYYVRIFSPGAAFALWAFAVYDFYRGFKYIGSLMAISSTIADLASGDGKFIVF
ncbi:hypothetical protein ACONW5_003953, partial [Yersinia enterocolitica]